MRVLTILVLLAGCAPEGRLGVWHATDIEIDLTDCGDSEPAEHYFEPFDIGISGITEDGRAPYWAAGRRMWITRGGLHGHGSNYGYGVLERHGFHTEPQVFSESEGRGNTLFMSIQHDAVLVDDLLLDWSRRTEQWCEEDEPGGCDYYNDSYPSGCLVEDHFTATWDRTEWD